MEMHKSIYSAIEKTYQKLLAIPEEEFKKELNRHGGGDIAKILLETRALEVGEIESKAFAKTIKY